MSDKINCAACGAIAAVKHRRGCPAIDAAEYSWDFSSTEMDPAAVTSLPHSHWGHPFVFKAPMKLWDFSSLEQNPTAVDCDACKSYGAPEHKTGCVLLADMIQERAEYLTKHPNAIVIENKMVPEKLWEEIQRELMRNPNRGIMILNCAVEPIGNGFIFNHNIAL